MASQIKDDVGNEQWMHANCLAAIADIFSRAFTMAGNCRFPLYITGEMAKEWFDVWRLINGRRMARNGWSFSGSSAETNTLQPTLAFSRSVAQRNHSRSRRRFLRARYPPSHPGMDPWDDKHHYVEPSVDEDLPIELPDAPPNSPDCFSPLLSSLDPRLDARGISWIRDPKKNSVRSMIRRTPLQMWVPRTHAWTLRWRRI